MIREAVTRYINAWASAHEARAEKLRCLHKWEEVWQHDVFPSPDAKRPVEVLYLYVCTSCGEHKKITMP